MKNLLLAFLLVPSLALAEECNGLSLLMEKLIEAGKLQGTKNLFSDELLVEEFPESCDITVSGKDYLLYLGSDDVSIVVLTNSENETEKLLYGRFFSAYRK